MAGAGDVNGDGYADVIVGRLRYDAGESDEGAAFVFLGSASGIADGNPATAAAQLESDQASAELGISVAGAGDVNGDGYADVIVGARFTTRARRTRARPSSSWAAPAGIADGNPATATRSSSRTRRTRILGISVAGAGDVNGDGYADVIVGAPWLRRGRDGRGRGLRLPGQRHGIADGNPTTAAAQLESDQAYGVAGLSVAGAGT